MTGTGVWAQLIRQRFDKASARLGFNRTRFELDLTQFRRPPAQPGQGIALLGQVVRCDVRDAGSVAVVGLEEAPAHLRKRLAQRALDAVDRIDHAALAALRLPSTP